MFHFIYLFLSLSLYSCGEEKKNDEDIVVPWVKSKKEQESKISFPSKSLLTKYPKTTPLLDDKDYEFHSKCDFRKYFHCQFTTSLYFRKNREDLGYRGDDIVDAGPYYWSDNNILFYHEIADELIVFTLSENMREIVSESGGKYFLAKNREEYKQHILNIFPETEPLFDLSLLSYIREENSPAYSSDEFVISFLENGILEEKSKHGDTAYTTKYSYYWSEDIIVGMADTEYIQYIFIRFLDKENKLEYLEGLYSFKLNKIVEE